MFGFQHSTEDRNYIEIPINNWIVNLESDSYRNRRPKLLESELELSTIRFRTPNRLSLVCREVLSGPLLFSLFVNNVAEALNLGKNVCHADDSMSPTK